MKYDNLKAIAGIAGDTTITSERLRYSELHALAERVGILELGTITIIVKSGTLCDSESEALAKTGGRYIRLDLTDL